MKFNPVKTLIYKKVKTLKRLQGAEYHARKDQLIPIAYSVTKAGNICLYYKGGYKHYLNDNEKASFSPDGLEERYKVGSNRLQ